MIFFTVLFGAFPLMALIVIPTILIAKAIEADGTDNPFTRRTAWKCIEAGLAIAAATTAFIAAVAWVANYWMPLMKSIFGV